MRHSLEGCAPAHGRLRDGVVRTRRAEWNWAQNSAALGCASCAIPVVISSVKPVIHPASRKCKTLKVPTPLSDVFPCDRVTFSKGLDVSFLFLFF